MQNLPDLEDWAIFSGVAETGSFAKAASLLGISQPTVSKAIARLEKKVGAMLLYRTTRRLSLTPTGDQLRERAMQLLADAQAFENRASALAIEPRGIVRISAPMSFGLRYLAPLLADFLARFPEVDVELTLTDRPLDIVAGGFDVAICIADLSDSSLRSRRLCAVRRPLVAAPTYLAQHGRPLHPRELERHAILVHTNQPATQSWRFRNVTSHDEHAVSVRGRLRTNNADAIVPALLAGQGIALQPEFLVWDALQRGGLEQLLCDWTIDDINVNLVTPPGMLRTTRITALLDFLVEHLAHAPWARSGR